MNDYSKAVRAAVRARIVTIDAEVHQLRERIRVLETERDTCKRRLEAYKYPVLALPNEITSEIFVHFLPHYPSCPPLAGIDSPTTLTQICRKWREIALANPKLWRGISIDFPHDRAEKLRVVQKWLDRSGSCPLSIKMECDYSGATTLNGYFQETLLHRARWQHVRLELRAEEVALIEGPMPLLESLYLAVDEWYYTHPTVSVSDFPRLRSVSLENASHGNWLPLSQLTTLTLNTLHGAHYLSLIQAAVNLVHLYLIDCAPPRSGTPNTFTRLETLVVLDKLGRRHTFDMLILPALRDLQWSGGLLGQVHINTVTSLISRSGCKLQQILFTGASEFSEECLRAAFPSVPKVAFDSAYDRHFEASTGFKNGLGL